MPDKRQLVPRQRRRPRDIANPVLLKIRDLAFKGDTALEIEGQLPAGDRPSRRTIYRIIEDVRPPDPSGTWKPLQSPLSAALVLPVLAALVEATGGRRSQLTNAEAGRIEALREAVPDLPPLETYHVAQAYVAGDYHKTGSEALDMLLAFGPWRSIEHTERYFGALNRGWIQAPDLWLLQAVALLGIPPMSPPRPGIIPSRPIDEIATPETWAYHQRFFSTDDERRTAQGKEGE